MSGYERDMLSLQASRATEDAVLEKCKEYGVCIIDSFLSEDRLADIRTEYERLYEKAGSNEAIRIHNDSDHTNALYVDYPKLSENNYGAIHDLVDTELFENITREYFDEDDVIYPSNLWTATSRGTPDAPTGEASDGAPYAYHFDRQNNFKFLFYLEDVAIEDGPTHFVPEYHDKYKQTRVDWIEAEKDIWDLSNVMWHYHVAENAEKKEVPITGDAGTLVIFDTDAPHRAGDLARGHERKIMRIDTLSPTHSGVDGQKFTASDGDDTSKLMKGVKNPGKAFRYVVNKATQSS